MIGPDDSRVSGCIFNQLDKVWFNPDGMQAFGLKFNMAVIIKPFDLVAASNQTFEKLLRAELVFNSQCVFHRPVSNHSEVSPIFGFFFAIRTKVTREVES